MTAATELARSAHGADTSDLKRRYVRAAVYSSVLGGISQMLYGVTPVIIARSLGPADYGVYSVVMSLVGIVIGVFGLGQNSALHKLVPQHYASDRQLGGAILANVLALTSAGLALFCGVVFLASHWIAAQLYRDVALSGAFRLGALLMLVLTLFTLAASALAGLQDFRAYNLVQVARNFALLGFTSGGIWWAGLRGALVGQLLASLFGLALAGWSGLRLVRARFPEGIRLKSSRRILRIIAAFVLPTLLMTLLNLPTYWWAGTMVARHAGFAQVGLLGVAYTLSQLTFLIPMNLYTPAMTFFSETHASLNSSAFSTMVNANLRAMWMFSLPLALGIGLFSPLLVRTLFGNAYLAAAPLTLAMSLTALLMLLVGLLNTALVAAGRVWHNLAITFGWTALFVIAGLFCIPRWGAAGCAALFAATYALYLVGVCSYARLALNVRFTGIARLALLTVIGFGLAVIFFFNFHGGTVDIASASLLVGLIVVEWIWIFDRNERDRLTGIVVGVVKRILLKQSASKGVQSWLHKMTFWILFRLTGRRSC